MTIHQFIMNILWAITVGSLVTFCVITFIVYRNSKEKAFLYYSAYCALIAFYVFVRIDMPKPIFKVFDKYYSESFNWYIQIIFYVIYQTFSIYFLDLNKSLPNLMKTVRFYQIAIVYVSSFLFLVTTADLLPHSTYTSFFTFLFVPLHTGISIYLIFKAFTTKSFVKNYYLFGFSAYIILAITAFIYSMAQKSIFGFDPITPFYLGVLIETIVFGYALGMKIQRDYKLRYQLQIKLSAAERALQVQLQNKLKLKEEENRFLLVNNEKNALAAQIAFLQTKVMRSQMNSHFIFNVLNSIKAFIIENEKENAVLYLNKFSKFIRKILDGSIYENSTLKEELETTDLYISIENMRFNDSIMYQRNIDPTLDLSRIQFPPLLLQPFIENAIWHGLSHIKDDKKLELEVKRKGNAVVIVICDNGIGYNQFSEKPSGHQSKGLKILEERIKEYNSQNNENLSFEIANLQAQGQRGTMVEIIIANALLPQNQTGRKA